MKERELRRHAVCSLCKAQIGQASLPIFYRIKIERFMLDLGVVQRQTGLGLLLGNGLLAMHMGPDEEMANSVMDQLTLVACHNCSTDLAKAYPVAQLAEIQTTVDAE